MNCPLKPAGAWLRQSTPKNNNFAANVGQIERVLRIAAGLLLFYAQRWTDVQESFCLSSHRRSMSRKWAGHSRR